MLLDQYGKPIQDGIKEPQTARVGMLQRGTLGSAIGSLTPRRIVEALRGADNGFTHDQHRLFADMEERDCHLLSEVSKRKNALTAVDWHIEPPPNASSRERKDAAWLDDVLRNGIDPIEDLILSLAEGIFYGFSAVEVTWNTEVDGWTPKFNPVPQEWFCLDETRTNLRLNVPGQMYGEELNPFGWAWHRPGKVKTGYGARTGLYRTLIWLFLYKTYALGDWAELLEAFGLPIIVGKHPSTSTDKEKNGLLQSIIALGHNARGVMPDNMSVEIMAVSQSGTGSPHRDMIEWAEKSQSKLVLGGTLTSQADGKTSTNALGNIHNEVRKDILTSDARQLAETLKRDVIYPVMALNKGLQDMRRCPRFVFETEEEADLGATLDNLTKASKLISIPAAHIYTETGIPEPTGDEAVVGGTPAPGTAPDQTQGIVAATRKGVVALGAAVVATEKDGVDAQAEQLAAAADTKVRGALNALFAMLEKAGDMEEFKASLAMSGLSGHSIGSDLEQAILAATLAGRHSVSSEQENAGQ